MAKRQFRPADNATTGRNETDRAALIEAATAQLTQQLDRHLDPALYLVATPIGNLGDITLRALATLAQVSVVYCEDTRHSSRLMHAFGIKTALRSYHDFSSDQERHAIANQIRDGKPVALISDAGTPLIADPGFKLVRELLQQRLKVYSIPGPSALLAALTASGFPTDTFLFAGFLPPKAKARVTRLTDLGGQSHTAIFYEAPQRIVSALQDIATLFPDRQVALCRELTKIYETTVAGTAAEILERMAASEPKGEFVVMLAGALEVEVTPETLERELSAALASMTLSDAVEHVRTKLGVQRKTVYNLALKISDKA
jgi:16S rRNA (cytidine1402-2'-O)-methyltransferase